MAKKKEAQSPELLFLLNFRDQSQHAKRPRTLKTRQNWDVYWERHDFGHKIPGQSRETLSMQPMAVEQTAAFFQQALVDIGDHWWSASAKNPTMSDKLKVRPHIIEALTRFQLNKADILKHVVRGVKSGLLGSVFITKTHGYAKPIPYYTTERMKKARKGKLNYSKKYAWQLCLDLVNDFNYYPDPTGEGLGEAEDMYMDYHRVLALSEGEDAIYDKAAVSKIEPMSGDETAEERHDEQKKTAQAQDERGYRNRVKLTEYWGTILDEEGNVAYDNCVMTVANDKYIIRPPTPNPLWHQGSPYEVTPLLEAPFGVWPRALMDSPTKHNIAANEIYNLMLDGAMRAANGVTEVRQDWLEDPSQVSDGIKPGTALAINSQCPPGATAVQIVKTGELPPDAMNMFNVMQQEFNRAALTSDIRQGMQPRKDVPATQIVEANQTITSVFTGLSKNIESHIQKVLEKSWMTCAQFSDDMDVEEVRTVLGEDADGFLAMTPEERFAETVGGIKFTVSGISLTMQKAQDYQKDMMFLQTVSAAPTLVDEFTKKYSWGKLLERMMRNLGIRTNEIELSQAEQEQMQPQPGGAVPQGQPQPGAGPAGPDMMSQVGQPQTGSLQSQLGSAAPIQSTMAAQATAGNGKPR